MNPFEMVVMIVAIVVAGSVIRAKLCARGDQQSPGTAADPTLRRENAQLSEELRALKARVATLERIVTDGSASLDREIEALRNRL